MGSSFQTGQSATDVVAKRVATTYASLGSRVETLEEFSIRLWSTVALDRVAVQQNLAEIFL